MEALLKPADLVRARTLKAFGRVARPFIVDRELRVAFGGAALVLMALAATAVIPMWMLALGPIIWGAPHLLSDVRYLVVRPGHHRRTALALAVGLPLLAAALGGGLMAGAAAVVGVALVSRTTPVRRALTLTIAAALVGGALIWGYSAELVFAHAHNFIAVALWWAWRPRQRRWHWLPLGLFVAASAALALGTLDPLIDTLTQTRAAPDGMDGFYFLQQLAPEASPTWGLRLVLLFAFAQAVHYGVWLRLMPDEDRPQSTPRTFQATWRALERDFGPWLLRLTVLGCAALALWATVDLVGARIGYLRMAMFHGHLELAAAALLLTEGRPRDDAAEQT